MNFLAHAYLSFQQEHILAGNMISDFVKGKMQYEYIARIQQGIRLHRYIDAFTDAHPAIKEIQKPFKAVYGLYAGPLADIVCDYFLANDTTEFSSAEMLEGFSKNTYALLDKHLDIFPAKFQHYFNYMKQGNWLVNYQYEWMIQKSFTGLASRAKYMPGADIAFNIFQKINRICCLIIGISFLC